MSSLGQTISGGANVLRGFEAGQQRQRDVRMQQLAIEEQNRANRLRQLAAQQPIPQAPDLAANLGQGMPVANVPIAGTGTGAGAAAAPTTTGNAAIEQRRLDAMRNNSRAAQAEAMRRRNAGASLGLPYQDVAGFTPPTGMTGPQNLALLQQERLRRFANPEQTAREDAAARQFRGAAQMSPEQAFGGPRSYTVEPPSSKRGSATQTAPTMAGAPLNFNTLAAAVEQVESGGREDAVSPKGALGPMQTMSGTLRDPGFGVLPAQNNSVAEQRRVGQDYLQAMLQKYDGNLDHALAAYNWGPSNTDRWIAAGADPAKLPKETREYIPKVKTAMGAAPAQPEITGAPTTPVENVAAATRKDPADFYLANAQAIPRDMQLALQGREELVRMAQLYQQSGMGLEFMQVRAEILKADNNMFYLQGMQGLQELEMANDPRRLATIWSEATGVPVGVQPRTDGKFNVFVNGRVTREGISSAQLADSARSSFDSAFRQQKGAASAAFNEKLQASMLKIQEGNALELAKTIRETTVEGVKGNIARALEYFKANANWDIKPTGAGDGTIIIRPPGSPPYLFNPAGRVIEIDGVKVPTNSAILIGGLPLPTQARLNQVR